MSLVSTLWLPHETDSVSAGAAVYAANGWPVFPCSGKQPLVSGGFKSASTDEKQVAEWWKQHPNANVGWPVQEGWVALDVDPRHGGDKSLVDLQREHEPLPWTLRATTGSGGAHWIYRIPDGVELRQLAGFRDGLDTRLGGRGYLLVAPSIHPDTKIAYRWHTTVEPVDPPAWLIEILRVPPRVEMKPYVPPPTWNQEQDRRRKYGLAALKGCAEEVQAAGKGQRNDTLNKAWWRMLQLRDAIPPDETRAALCVAALSCGLAQHEIDKVLR